MDIKKYFGPSTLVAAAFIGPGTVTTCTMAGVQSGYTLLWAMVFSVAATIILQEMAARLGWVTQQGLGEAIHQNFTNGISRNIALFLVLGAIVVGNAAYEAGNLSGGVLGLELLMGEFRLWPLVIGVVSFALLYYGKYKLIEKILIGLVLLMSMCFILTVIIIRPDFLDIMSGFVPSFSEMDILLVLGLIGTTVVPYNLFLHASTISKKWSTNAQLKDIRKENAVAIILGGIISMLIIITAAATTVETSTVSSAADLARQLEPAFGSSAKYLMGVGLMSAGISSALTAPLAAAYAAQGIFGWEKGEHDPKFRMAWMAILLIGVTVAMTGLKPIMIIKFAQITNAVLLPFIAGFLIYISNKSSFLGQYVNSTLQNILATGILIITISLSLRSLNNIFHIF